MKGFLKKLLNKKVIDLDTLKDDLAQESVMHFADGTLYGMAMASLGKELPRDLIAKASVYFAQTLNEYIKREINKQMEIEFLSTQRTFQEIVEYLNLIS